MAALSLFASLILAIPCTAQAIPPAQPTAQPKPVSSPPTATKPAAHRATVEYTAGKLAIAADNSSLNQILRDIARVTGMTITGGVLDERVFGTYGPADTSTVLSALLNGTGSNMLLIQDAHQFPQQLVLTPRQGGPSPPSPNALSDSAATPGESDLPPQLNPRTSRQLQTPPPQPSFNGALPAAPTLPAEPPTANPAPAPNPVQSANTTPPANAAPATPDAEGPKPPPANATTEQSPNGVKTPQQIYDQLMKLQQQQAKPPEQP